MWTNPQTLLNLMIKVSVARNGAKLVPPDVLHWEEVSIMWVTFLPRWHNLKLLMRKQHTILNWESVCNTTDLSFPKCKCHEEQRETPELSRRKADWRSMTVGHNVASGIFCASKGYCWDNWKNRNKVHGLNINPETIFTSWFWSLCYSYVR